jgi:hypothetical protein
MPTVTNPPKNRSNWERIERASHGSGAARGYLCSNWERIESLLKPLWAAAWGLATLCQLAATGKELKVSFPAAINVVRPNSSNWERIES